MIGILFSFNFFLIKGILFKYGSQNLITYPITPLACELIA